MSPDTMDSSHPAMAQPIARCHLSGMAPRVTIHCIYAGTELPPTCVTFGLSPEYGFTSAGEAHDWFVRMVAQHEEFAVQTDQPGEEAMPFRSETVRQVVVE